MATLSLDDPRFQPLTPEEEEKRKKQKKITEANRQDLVKAGIDETDIELPEAEDNNEVSGATAFAAGLASGAIKVGEGVVSLGAELIDLGGDTNTAAAVEQFFDDLNPFEEIAEQRAIGKLTEALIQIGVPGGAGAKAATMAARALKAKRAVDAISTDSTKSFFHGVLSLIYLFTSSAASITARTAFE